MKRSVWVLILLVSLMSAGLAQAQTPPDSFTRVSDGIFSQTLANGLQVIVVEDHVVPLVTVEICVKNGAFTESPEYDGLSHLYEHMFFKGNEVLPNQEAYLERMRELGLVWNGTTSSERVNYFFTMTTDRWREGLEFMRDAIRAPLFDETELKKERVVVLDELSRNEASPYFHLNVAMDALLWGDLVSRKNVIGDRAIIETATREKMLTVQRKYYVPNNSALFVSGDVDPQTLFAAVEELYGGWAPSEVDPFVAYPLPEHPPLTANQATLVEKPIKKAVVTLTWLGPDTRNERPATYAADVLSFIFNQEGSSFQRKLVDSGLTLGASFGYFTQQNVGPISLSFSVQPEKLEEALRAVSLELEQFADPTYFTDEQLAIAKTLLEVDDVYGREQITAWTHTLSFWWAVAGLDYYLGYVDALKAVERADMERYVKTYILGKPCVIGVLLSSESREQLALTPAKVLEWAGRTEAGQ